MRNILNPNSYLCLTSVVGNRKIWIWGLYLRIVLKFWYIQEYKAFLTATDYYYYRGSSLFLNGGLQRRVPSLLIIFLFIPTFKVEIFLFCFLVAGIQKVDLCKSERASIFFLFFASVFVCYIISFNSQFFFYSRI